MIITRTPLRVSFAGGGSDLRSYYQHEPGAVTSTAIKKYIYVTINRKFDDRIRVSYSKTELVDHVAEVKHDLVREAMKLTGVRSGVEITTIADIPGSGTGLGSSSALTVGLLNALYAYKGTLKSREALAAEACRIEIDRVGEPIGKQDQYAAAFGGIQHIQFLPDETVYVDPVLMKPEVKVALQNRLLMFYTGITRRSSSILQEQKKETPRKMEILRKMVILSKEVRESLMSGRLDEFGRLLHKGWELKKQMASGISSPEIDEMYERGLGAGALGGKILGAGGGGFLLFYVPEGLQDRLRDRLSDLKEMPFRMEPQGTRIIYVGD